MSSKVVLSFANNAGGTVFVHVFRNKLMKVLNFFNDNDIYLDNVACRSAAGSVYHGPDLRQNKGDQGGGAHTIGVSNENWEMMWTEAVDTAKAVIVILTPDYVQSGNCAKELQTIGEKLKTNSNLHLIVLDMGPDDLRTNIPQNLSPSSNPKSRFIQLSRGTLSGEMQKIFPGSFDLTDRGYELVAEALSAAGVK